jgi:hypothetical protein
MTYRYINKYGIQNSEMNITENQNELTERETLTLEPKTKLPSFKANNLTKLPKDVGEQYLVQNTKGNGIIGGFNAISGEGRVSDNQDKSYKKPLNKTIAVPLEINNDLDGLTHYRDINYKQNEKPMFLPVEIIEPQNYQFSREDVDYGFTHSRQWGLRTKKHGLTTTGVNLPTDVIAENLEDIDISLGQGVQDEALRSKRGYRDYVPHSVFGAVPNQIPAEEIINTMGNGTGSSGSGLLSAVIPVVDPYGYNLGGGYNAQGIRTKDAGVY